MTTSRLFGFLPLAFCAMASLASADDDESAGRPRTLSPYFQVQSGDGTETDRLPLKDTHVEVTIAGVIAEVAVLQTYINEGTTPLDAIYVFPGSTRAAVHGLTMLVGDRIVHAKIQTKPEARRTFEAAKSAGKTASLLEQHRPNVFQMSLTNIMPGETVQVELHYTELLRVADGEYEFAFPTVVGPRYSSRSIVDEEADEHHSVRIPYLAEGDQSGATFALKLHLATGVPLADLQCATHAITIARPRPDVAQIELDPAADPEAQANRDFILHYRLAGDAVQTGLLLTGGGPNGDGGYFLAMVQPPARPAAAAAPACEYVFVVDVSGSMRGFPLDTARALLTDLIENLRAEDSFNVVLFAGDSTVLSPVPLAATPENLARAIVVLEQQRGGGGTELLTAFQRALALPRKENLSRTLVLITDGFVGIEAEAFDFVRSHLDRANLFAFGIGSSVNRHLIESLARAGQGEPFIVTSSAEAAATAARFRLYIASPVLTRVRAEFAGFVAEELTPRAIPDVFAQRPVVLFGRWHGPLGGRIHVHGVNGEGELTSTLEVANAVRLDGSRALELLWARARVQELEDKEACEHDAAQVSAITQLGLTHGLLTKYTSFVAVDERVRNIVTGSSAVKQPVPLPEGVSNSAVGQSVPTTPEPGTVGLITLTALALASRWWRRRGAPAHDANAA